MTMVSIKNHSTVETVIIRVPQGERDLNPGHETRLVPGQEVLVTCYETLPVTIQGEPK